MSADAPRSDHDEATVVLPGQDPEGRHLLSVLLKRRYRITAEGTAARLLPARALVAGDSFAGDPMRSPILDESDFVPFKLATDVVIHANAHAPQGGPVQAMSVAVQVGDQVKTLEVIGDRRAVHAAGRQPVFTDPEPFVVMPITYDRAYGGVDVRSDTAMPCLYARNHLGRGFVVANTAEALADLDLPNIEATADRLTPDRLCCGHFMHWQRQPHPDGFGWTMKYWQPRASLAGVMPADRALESTMRAHYATLLPPAERKLYLDNPLPPMDFAFFNGASPGLVRPYLFGDEVIVADGLDPAGRVAFRLPGERPRLGLDTGAVADDAPAVLHTVVVRLEAREVDLVWRSAFPYAGPQELPRLQRLQALVD